MVLGLPDNGYRAVLDWVLAVRDRIGIPHTLAELGVTLDHIPILAPMAAADPSAPTNPVAPDEGACATLYEHCIEGTIAP